MLGVVEVTVTGRPVRPPVPVSPALDVAVNAALAPIANEAGNDVNVIAWGRSIRIAWITGVAGRYWASPSWAAPTTQTPPPEVLTVSPLTVQLPLTKPKLTGNPEVAVATSVAVPPSGNAVGLKLMVWVDPIGTVCKTCGAKRYWVLPSWFAVTTH
jgi:hypothetical protein